MVATVARNLPGSLPLLHASLALSPSRPVAGPLLRTATVTLPRAGPVVASLGPPAAFVNSAAAAFVAPPPWTHDAGCAVGLALASTVWIKVCNALATSGTISKANSRKLVHIGSGPGFVLIWPFFSRLPSAQIAAITVPILSLAKLYAAGRAPAGSERGAELVAAISRTGDRSEALGGPFLYTIVLLLASLFGFRSVASIVAICQMAIGDGMADLVGRRFGTVKWPLPFARQKSLVGTAAFAGFAWLACLGMLALYRARGFTALTVAAAAPGLLAVSVACALIELLPIGDDNLTVPAAGALLTVWLEATLWSKLM